MPITNVNGLNIYHEEQGQGDPLLMIMGLGAHSLLWLMQTPVLAQRFRTITFDNRGAGRTEKPPGPYSIRGMADDAAGLLDALGVERAHVLGISMGGMVAQELAINYPEKVNKLVLMSTLAKPEPRVTEWWLGFGEWVREREPDPRQFGMWALPWLYTSNFLGNLPMVEAAINQATLDPFPMSAEAFKAQAAACRAHDTLDRLGQIGSPTLVLVGKDDILTPVVYSQALAERIPGAHLRILERGGHGMLVEYAADVNTALLEFLGAPVEMGAGAASQPL